MKYFPVRTFILFLSSVLCAIGIYFQSAEPVLGQGMARNLFDLLPSCTAQHGYSLKNSEGLGDYEIGAGELAWRSCVYDGIREEIIPNSVLPNLYKNLIQNDSAMTGLIGKKVLTRKDRRDQNLSAIREIEQQENQYLAVLKKQMQEQAKTKESIQSMQNVLEIQRRSFEIRRSTIRGFR